MSSKVKRPCEEGTETAKILIFDIEGTTTSITFVKDTLFPYIKSNLEAYVSKQWDTEELKEDVALLRKQAAEDEFANMDGFVTIPTEGTDAELQASVVANVLWQMSTDRKNTALKQLQGHIMREGYQEGKLKGHVYTDVVPALRTWAESGYKLFVYSSGSVAAQKLLFKNSEHGDLLGGHFDTEVGLKTDADSYRNILKQSDSQPEGVCFFTDVPAEALAAEKAGMTAVLVVREGNAPLSDEDRAKYQVIESFDGFELGAPTKRRKVSADEGVEACDVEMREVSEVSPNIPSVAEVETDKTECIAKTDVDDKVDATTDVPHDKTDATMEVVETTLPTEEQNSESAKTGETIPLEPIIEEESETVEKESVMKEDSTSDTIEAGNKELENNVSPDSNADDVDSKTTAKISATVQEIITAAMTDPEEAKTCEEISTATESENEKKVISEVPEENVPKVEEPLGKVEETSMTEVADRNSNDKMPVVGNGELKSEAATSKAEEEVEEKLEDAKVDESVAEKDAMDKEEDSGIELTTEPSEPVSGEDKAEVNVEAQLTGEADKKVDLASDAVVKETPKVEVISANSKVEEGQGDTETLTEVSKNIENGKDSAPADEIKVEEGQGDTGTLTEVSKNVENGKDSPPADEIKVKKVMVENGSDDTENAVPVTMET